MEYSFNTNIAKEFDVDIAIFLNNMKFWTLRNLSNGKHIHDGLCWSYNTIPGFCNMFKFWSRHQIEHLIRKMKQLGLITTANYNHSKYDRTCWYALTLKGLSLFPELCDEDYLAKMYESISENSEMDKLNPEWGKNQEIDLGKFRDETLKIPRPIPDTKPDTDITNVISDEKLKLPNQQKKPINTKLSLKELVYDNPHNIPEYMLQEWLDIRKDKRARVTPSAWQNLNDNLSLIQIRLHINPIEAFRTMVAKCWQTVELKYFKDTPEQQQKFNNDCDLSHAT